jgi:hypothetical protein
MDGLTMRVVLDVVRAPDGVLSGTTRAEEQPCAARFHGVLELVAAVERAIDPEVPARGDGVGPIEPADERSDSHGAG